MKNNKTIIITGISIIFVLIGGFYYLGERIYNQNNLKNLSDLEHDISQHTDNQKRSEKFQCGQNVTFIYNEIEVTYGTIKGQNQTCWLDRNLGALRSCISVDDYLCYGDLFQWGRGDDGHQVRTSSNTFSLSSSDSPDHKNFISTINSNCDWRNPRNDNLWQGVDGVNNPCPPGWRIPTHIELEDEMKSWGTGLSSELPFNSSLKWPLPGLKIIGGKIDYIDLKGFVWSSSVDYHHAKALFIDLRAVMGACRDSGYSVRCIYND